MPKTPKVRPKIEPPEPESDKEKSWEEDQKKREYYYDDAHGYEVYKPDEEEDEIGSSLDNPSQTGA